MIYDKLSNIHRYLGLNANMDVAIEYITHSLVGMPDHVDICDTEVYGNVCNYYTVPEDDSFFEAHANYADIQIMRSGAERIGVSDVSLLKVDEAHPDRDFWSLHGSAEVILTLTPDSFLIVFPGEAHKLKMMIHEPQYVRKSVFKVRLK